MSASDLTRGMLIRHQNDLYQVVDFGEQHTGKQKPKTHVTLRHLRTGHTGDKLLDVLEPIEEVPHEMRDMQFLYAAGADHTFMDGDSYEQFTVSQEQLDKAVRFLIEGETYKLFCVDGVPLSLQLPDAMVLEVTDTAPPTHGGSPGSNVMKEAVVASGLTVRVPLFIKNGDRIRVDTQTGKYVGKEKES
jgi:elongation factor P